MTVLWLMKSMSCTQDPWLPCSLQTWTVQPGYLHYCGFVRCFFTPRLKDPGSKWLRNTCAGSEFEVLIDQHRKEGPNRLVRE